MSEDARYTLAEAEQMLRRRDCSVLGHSWHIVEVMGAPPTAIICTRCNERHEVTS